MQGRGALAHEASVDAIDIVVAIEWRAVGVLCHHVADAYGIAVVVGLACHVRLIEMHAVRPLFGLSLFFPTDPVACPVLRGCATDDEPEVLAVGRTVKGDYLIGLTVIDGCNVTIDTSAVFLECHKADSPTCARLIISNVSFSSCLPLKRYNTAVLIKEQTFGLRLAVDFYREFDALLKEKNVLGLDDSNTLLRDIIDGSDAPFVYEKMGVRFESFLLDEFQDLPDFSTYSTAVR